MRRKPKQAASTAARLVLPLALLVCLLPNCALGQAAKSDIVLKTALHHPIQYYLSLPEGWTADKKWPVVFTIEGGLKNFRNSAEVYATARKHMRFIIVSPVILTDGGGDDQRNLPEYHYASEVWDQIGKTGICAFDQQGLDAIMTDLRQQYGTFALGDGADAPGETRCCRHVVRKFQRPLHHHGVERDATSQVTGTRVPGRSR